MKTDLIFYKYNNRSKLIEENLSLEGLTISKDIDNLCNMVDVAFEANNASMETIKEIHHIEGLSLEEETKESVSKGIWEKIKTFLRNIIERFKKWFNKVREFFKKKIGGVKKKVETISKEPEDLVETTNILISVSDKEVADKDKTASALSDLHDKISSSKDITEEQMLDELKKIIPSIKDKGLRKLGLTNKQAILDFVYSLQTNLSKVVDYFNNHVTAIPTANKILTGVEIRKEIKPALERLNTAFTKQIEDIKKNESVNNSQMEEAVKNAPELHNLSSLMKFELNEGKMSLTEIEVAGEKINLAELVAFIGNNIRQINSNLAAAEQRNDVIADFLDKLSKHIETKIDNTNEEIQNDLKNFQTSVSVVMKWLSELEKVTTFYIKTYDNVIGVIYSVFSSVNAR